MLYSFWLRLFPEQGSNLRVPAGRFFTTEPAEKPPFHAFSNGVSFSLQEDLQRVLEQATDEWLTYLPSKDAWVTRSQF